MKIVFFLFLFSDCRFKGSDTSGAKNTCFSSVLAKKFAFSGLSELVGFFSPSS